MPLPKYSSNAPATPVLKVYTNERVYYRGKRMVKNGTISCFYKKFTATELRRYNHFKMCVFELSNGEFYAQTIGGNYVFKLERIPEKKQPLSTNYLNYLRSLK